MTTTPLTNEEAIDQFELRASYPDLNVDHLRASAAEAAALLVAEHPAAITLQPDDGTTYYLLITPPSTPTVMVDATPSWRFATERQFTVVLCNPFGAAYPWNGWSLHWSYGDKWVNNGNSHTAKIVTLFLTLVAEVLAPRKDDE